MNKIALAKTAVRFTVTTSVSFVVSNVITNNVNPSKPHQKVEAYVGAIALGMFVADKAEPWIDEKFDSVVTAIRELKSKSDTK